MHDVLPLCHTLCRHQFLLVSYQTCVGCGFISFLACACRPGTDRQDRAAALDAHNRLSNFGNVKSTALFFGGVVYAFEGIGMVRHRNGKA